jgi:L-aspartate oxidase
MKITSDFLVIGSGVAGLADALKVANHGAVCIITKREISETATNLAQGGIASVISAEDSFDSHIRDTMVAGAFLSHEDVVRLVVESGAGNSRPHQWGVQFTKKTDDTYDLTREGHSERRILCQDPPALRSNGRWWRPCEIIPTSPSTSSISLWT